MTVPRRAAKDDGPPRRRPGEGSVFLEFGDLLAFLIPAQAEADDERRRNGDDRQESFKKAVHHKIPKPILARTAKKSN